VGESRRVLLAVAAAELAVLVVAVAAVLAVAVAAVLAVAVVLASYAIRATADLTRMDRRFRKRR